MGTQPTVSDAVHVEFTLGLGGDRELDASVDVPAYPVTITQLLPVLHELSSNVVGAFAQGVEAEGAAVSCRAGCGACCRQLVPLTLFEADALARWVRSLPPEQQLALEARFQRALAGLQAGAVLARLNPAVLPKAGSDQLQQLAIDYLQQRVPCPFLQDEACSIHPIRPLVCREYLVTSPAEFCVLPTRETVRPVPMPVKFSKALVALGEELTADGTGWIPLVLLFAWIRTGASLDGAPAAPGPAMLQLVLEKLTPQT